MHQFNTALTSKGEGTAQNLHSTTLHSHLTTPSNMTATPVVHQAPDAHRQNTTFIPVFATQRCACLESPRHFDTARQATQPWQHHTTRSQYHLFPLQTHLRLHIHQHILHIQTPPKPVSGTAPSASCCALHVKRLEHRRCAIHRHRAGRHLLRGAREAALALQVHDGVQVKGAAAAVLAAGGINLQHLAVS
jgi:hypothetical protein